MACPRKWIPLAVALSVPVIAGTAWADRIRLRGGGELRGVIVADPKQADKTLVQTESGSQPLVFDREQVVQVITESGPLDTYFARRGDVAQTAEAQYEFGQWCEQQRLTGLAENHYRRAAELDSSFAPAQKKLGHVLHEGRWITYDELRAAQGLVFHKGRWIPREERDEIGDREARAAEQTSWIRQIRVLRKNLESSDAEQRRAAEATLAEIRDPAAIAGLVQVLGADTPAYRALLARLLGAIPGPEARDALMARALVETDRTARQTTLEEFARRLDPDAIAALHKRLAVKDPKLVGRAATVLGELGESSAVPKLIPLLVRSARRPVMVPSGSAPPPPTITFASGQVQSWPILTGPVVGPGVVAYGATSVPFASGVMMGYGEGSRAPTVRMVTLVYRNAEVLAALESLTGMNFGYDEAAWRRWWEASRAEAPPAKRVRQP
jgi:hypothetical protein